MDGRKINYLVEQDKKNNYNCKISFFKGEVISINQENNGKVDILKKRYL